MDKLGSTELLISISIVGIVIYMLSVGLGVDYGFKYEEKVKQTVCEMVKKEYLKDPCND